MGALWLIYELVLFIHDLFVYVSMGMYLRKGKIIRRLWSIKSMITPNGT